MAGFSLCSCLLPPEMKKSEPLISVIVPVYNTAAWLPRCLESICAQSYANLEILCIDDGSTDGSAGILEEYAARDTRIRIIRQANEGVSAARNKATAQACGEWVTYVDSDDWIDPTIIDVAASRINEDVDVVSFGVVMEWEPDFERPAGVSSYFTLHEQAEELPCTPETAAYLNRAVWGKLWRLRVIAEHAVHSPVGLRHEDDAFFYFFMRHCRKMALCPEVGYYYLQRKGSFVHSGQSGLETARIYEKVFRYVCDFVRKSGADPVDCEWCRTFLTRLHEERYSALRPEQRAETSSIFYAMARENGFVPRYDSDYRFRCMKPVNGWHRCFLSRYLYTELWRFLGVPVWEVEYREGRAVQQRFMLLRFIGGKLGIKC